MGLGWAAGRAKLGQIDYLGAGAGISSLLRDRGWRSFGLVAIKKATCCDAAFLVEMSRKA